MVQRYEDLLAYKGGKQLVMLLIQKCFYAIPTFFFQTLAPQYHRWTKQLDEAMKSLILKLAEHDSSSPSLQWNPASNYARQIPLSQGGLGIKSFDELKHFAWATAIKNYASENPVLLGNTLDRVNELCRTTWSIKQMPKQTKLLWNERYKALLGREPHAATSTYQNRELQASKKSVSTRLFITVPLFGRGFNLRNEDIAYAVRKRILLHFINSQWQCDANGRDSPYSARCTTIMDARNNHFWSCKKNALRVRTHNDARDEVAKVLRYHGVTVATEQNVDPTSGRRHADLLITDPSRPAIKYVTDITLPHVNNPSNINTTVIGILRRDYQKKIDAMAKVQETHPNPDHKTKPLVLTTHGRLHKDSLSFLQDLAEQAQQSSIYPARIIKADIEMTIAKQIVANEVNELFRHNKRHNRALARARGRT